MARSEQIEQRLLRWAQAVTVGDGAGYPVKSVLHEDWSPPSGGITPTMKVSAPSDARATHEAIGRLRFALRQTLVVHYVMRWPIERQAQWLECQPRTVYARVEEAHAALRRELGSFRDMHESV